MKRKTTFIPPSENIRGKSQKRNLTFVQGNNKNISHIKAYQPYCKKFAYDILIVNDFLQEVLMSKVGDKIHQIQLKKIVKQTVEHCNDLVQHENLQINPNGPQQDRQKQIKIVADQQPISKVSDPILGFDKMRIVKRIMTQHSIQQSRHMPINKMSKRHSLLRPADLRSSRNSVRSNVSNKSILEKRVSDVPKLIPLKLDKQNISEMTSRRNVQDILRDKKSGRSSIKLLIVPPKLRVFKQEKQSLLRNLKTIEQVKQKNILKTSKQMMITTQNSNFTQSQIGATTSGKGTYTSRQEYNYNFDYDGDMLPLKKITTHMKKNLEIVKSAYKFKEQDHEQSKQNKRLKNSDKKQIIKLDPLIKKQSVLNLKPLNFRVNTENDMKMKLQNKLLSNRVMFRQLNDNEKFKFQSSEQAKEAKIVTQKKIAQLILV